MKGEGQLSESQLHKRETQAPVGWRSTQGVEGRHASDAVVAQYRDGVNNAAGGQWLSRRLRLVTTSEEIPRNFVWDGSLLFDAERGVHRGYGAGLSLSVSRTTGRLYRVSEHASPQGEPSNILRWYLAISDYSDVVQNLPERHSEVTATPQSARDEIPTLWVVKEHIRGKPTEISHAPVASP
jgi:hypothetical protein